MNREESLLKLLQDHVVELTGTGVRAVGIFASIARGEANDRSDVDILVEFQPDAETFQNFNRACDFLEHHRAEFRSRDRRRPQPAHSSLYP